MWNLSNLQYSQQKDTTCFLELSFIVCRKQNDLTFTNVILYIFVFWGGGGVGGGKGGYQTMEKVLRLSTYLWM